MTVDLPLFPLGTVLVPHLVLPLHVFEERYRLLVRELLERPEGERRFGVVAIRAGREVGADGVRALHDVGCTAELQRADPHPDGRFDVVTVGGTRFRLHDVDATSRPWLVGRVDLLPEEVGGSAEGEAALVTASVQAVFRAYVDALGRARGRPVPPPDLPDDPLLLGHLVAASAVVDLDEAQALLAQPDAVSRLRAELALLKRETTMLRRLTAAPAPELARVPVSPN